MPFGFTRIDDASLGCGGDAEHQVELVVSMVERSNLAPLDLAEDVELDPTVAAISRSISGSTTSRRTSSSISA